MSYFDIVINFIEAFTYIGFLYFVFHRKKGIIPLIAFVTIKALNTTLYNYFLLPEILLTITSSIIYFVYACYLNKKNYTQNLFLTIFINIINNISITLSMIIIRLFFSFPFYEGNIYTLLVVLNKIISIFCFITAYFVIQNFNILSNRNRKNYLIITIIFILNILYSACMEIIFYNSIFDIHMIIILISVNILTLFLCFIFIESQKEQKLLLELQKNELIKESQQKIDMINQKNINHLKQWKHDITYIFSYISTCIQNKNTDKALDTISFYNNIINNYNLIYSTNNDVLNSVLVENNEQLINNHIHLYINTDQEEVPIDEKDYRLILNTFLSVAIENCYSEYQKEIWISSFQKSPYFSLTLEYTNHIDSFVSINKDIESILHKYDGLMSEKQNIDKYKLTMIIPLHSLD